MASSTLKKVSTPCLDDHQIPPEDFEAKGELAKDAAKIVLKVLYLARVGRPDLYWTVNSLAREVTKWTVACDKRLHRLMSYMQHTRDWVQTCFVGDPVEALRLVLFADASFAGDLRDSKSTSGGFLCLSGPRTFVPISWICKKQGAVSHSSSEAEVISLDAGIRMEGIPALLLWDLVVDVFTKGKGETSRPKAKGETLVPKASNYINDILSHVDYVPCTLPKSSGQSRLLVMEDNEAVIKMTIKGRSPTMRHVARTHRIDLDWLFERIRDDPGIFLKYINTKFQLADILTKGMFTADQWSSLCKMMVLGPVSDRVPVKSALPKHKGSNTPGQAGLLIQSHNNTSIGSGGTLSGLASPAGRMHASGANQQTPRPWPLPAGLVIGRKGWKADDMQKGEASTAIKSAAFTSTPPEEPILAANFAVDSREGLADTAEKV